MKKILLFSFIVLVLGSCGKKNSLPNGNVVISGAGATFPYPFYNIVFRNYMKQNQGTAVNYGAIGSGGGIRSLRDRSVDFGASDAFLSEKELESMQAEVIHIATCMGGVVMAYKLSGVDSLRLNGDLIADIFMGNITRWNDARISQENPNINLPDLEITSVYRSDGSGTTFNFSEYLCSVSDEWNRDMGKGKALKWSAGIAAKGNPGVAGIVQQTEGAIGYIGSEYALTLKLPMAKLKNKAGNYVAATLETISSAANINLPDDMRITLTNSADPNAYPISVLTWILVYKDQQYGNRTEKDAQDLIDLLAYMLTPEGQRVAAQINFAPLSEQALMKTRKLISEIHYSGKVLSSHKLDEASLTTDSLTIN
ncbi:MAG: phosphate ABC transporter substrate-binding protein PstS [Bacteroidia bacterium]|nr:phosphate ABC transporter substrate-binding protein PstS [Bacteroidia bacterium]